MIWLLCAIGIRWVLVMVSWVLRINLFLLLYDPLLLALVL